MIKVAIVDDHVVVRKGIISILEKKEMIKIILEASDGIEFLNLLKDTGDIPEIVIMDLSMPKLNGTDTLLELRKINPSIQVLVFSLLNEEDVIINMIYRGACGYVHKSADPSILVEAILSIHKNGFYIGEWVKKNHFKKASQQLKRDGFYGKQYLTEKEIHFIKLAASNFTYPEIADRMGIRPKTLENYRDSLFQKLDINNRTALVLYGIKNGIITLEH